MVEHGGNNEQLAATYGFSQEECVDFSANINPLGVSKRLKRNIIDSISKLESYPDIHYTTPRQFLADFHGCQKENILLANGAVEIFYELARNLKPKNVLTLSPTFLEYEKAFLLVGSTIHRAVLSSPTYSWGADTIFSSCESFSKGDVVILCNPNNPTGTLVSIKVIAEIASTLYKRGIYLILDEAFIEFIDQGNNFSFVPLLMEYPNVIVVRSLTKFYAIPGLRLGYAVTYFEKCLQEIDENRPPWSVNALAAQAVPIILSDKNYQNKTINWLQNEKKYLYEKLTLFKDLRVVKPTVNYIFFEYLGKLDLREELRRQKIFIRSCQNYHSLTNRHYRIAIRSREENDQLLQALRILLDRS